MIAALIEQAFHHVVAATIVEAAVAKGLKLSISTQVRETMGSGVEGVVDGRPSASDHINWSMALASPRLGQCEPCDARRGVLH